MGTHRLSRTGMGIMSIAMQPTRVEAQRGLSARNICVEKSYECVPHVSFVREGEFACRARTGKMAPKMLLRTVPAPRALAAAST